MRWLTDDWIGFVSGIALVCVALLIWVFRPNNSKSRVELDAEPNWAMLASMIGDGVQAPKNYYSRMTHDSDTLVIGDSMVMGWPEKHGDVLSFPTQTTNQIADSLDRMTVRPYKKIILWAGTAELGIPWDRDVFEAGFHRLLAWSREHAATVLVVQPAPVTTDSGWVPHDVSTEWMRNDRCDSGWFRDGLHPSTDGYNALLRHGVILSSGRAAPAY